MSTKSNTSKGHIRELIETRLPLKLSLNRINGFELANMYDMILVPLKPTVSKHDINIHILWWVMRFELLNELNEIFHF